jgi:hypothetical protein
LTKEVTNTGFVATLHPLRTLFDAFTRPTSAFVKFVASDRPGATCTTVASFAPLWSRRRGAAQSASKAAAPSRPRTMSGFLRHVRHQRHASRERRRVRGCVGRKIGFGRSISSPGLASFALFRRGGLTASASWGSLGQRSQLTTDDRRSMPGYNTRNRRNRRKLAGLK